MIHSLLATKAIFTLLQRSEELTEMLPSGNIYSIAAVESTKYPFCTIHRQSILPYSSKDGRYMETVTVQINVVHTSYKDGLLIADKIREVLEKNTYSDDDITIKRTLLSGAVEQFYNNAYIQTLTFTCDVS